MIKSFQSEKGGTLMLVFGFIVMISIVIASLAMSTSIGLLQAKTNANSEKSFTDAHSGMTVFARMYEDMKQIDETNNTLLNINRLVKIVNGMDQLNVQAEIVNDSHNKPIAVVFKANYGNGNQVRASKLKYNLVPLHVPTAPPIVVVPTPTPGPTPSPTPPVPSTGNKVIMKNSNNTTDNKDNKNNKIFAACYILPATGQALPTSHILNEYTDAQFQAWFAPTADYYINHSSNVISDAFQNVFTDNRFSDVAALDNNVTSSELYKKQSGPAIVNAGTINIGEVKNSTITNDIVINSNSDGNSIEATGNLYFKDIVDAKVQFDGDVRVGGNLTFKQINKLSSITFKKNVLVKGNVVIGEGGTNDTIIIDGDLIVGGNLVVKNSLNNLIVTGDIIVNGDVEYNNTVLRWHVNGGMVVKGSIKATNGITSFDVKKDVVVQGGMLFTNPVAESRDGVAGLFLFGGSLKVKGLLQIKNTVYGFVVAGDVIVNQNLIFNDVIKKNFQVGGSFHIKGNLLLENTVFDFNVLGNVVVEGDFTVNSTIEKAFNIKGSLVSKGNIVFKNTIQSDAVIKIGENLISKTDLTFGNWTLNGSLDVGGMLLVFENATFQNLKKDWNSNQTKGFYVGGTTNFNTEYATPSYLEGLDKGYTQERICIK
ncbi:hypothetical protein [Bacillus sp. FJAT-28004]|uniref:hypothetical protein n=1 Tax=Bacillus sp. FJAT-28004 TaxID=1679165 RepID=UPI0006B5DFEB|nr:hypothetical protein [Bacillus sp. FJAT-28004]